MQECFEKHPEEYGKYADNDDDDSEEPEKREGEGGSRDKGREAEEQKGEEEVKRFSYEWDVSERAWGDRQLALFQSDTSKRSSETGC